MRQRGGMMDRINYTEFEGGFDQIILEESVVLNLRTTMSFVEFQMNFAVNEKYPLYTPPESASPRAQAPPREDVFYDEEEGDYVEFGVEGEDSASEAASESSADDTPAYSYRRGRIFFPNMEQVRWNSRIQPYIDPATGSVDYGAIDYFYKMEDRYYLAGYWGELDLVSGPPLLEIDELKQHEQAQKSNPAARQG